MKYRCNWCGKTEDNVGKVTCHKCDPETATAQGFPEGSCTLRMSIEVLDDAEALKLSEGA